MSPRDEHHDLALMLLAGRSLPDGLPWSYDEDRMFITRERALWALLDEKERAQEQAFLVALWAEENRRVTFNPKWGEWAKGLKNITVPDEAFGIPRHDFRPYPKGPPVEDFDGYIKVVQWLWNRGFQVVDKTPEGWLSIVVPSHRGTNEADRLVGLLAKFFPHLIPQPLGSALGVQIRSVYDPVSGRVFIEVAGLDDFMAFGISGEGGSR